MTTELDLNEVAAALRNAQRDDERATWFVPSHRLGIERNDQPEPQLVRLLLDDPHAHVCVEGPAGSGKTSLITYALSHLAAFNHVSIVIRIRVGHEAVTFDALQQALLAEIAGLFAKVDSGSTLHTIANWIDLDELAKATAEKVTTSQPGKTVAVQAGFRAGLQAGVTTVIAAAATAHQGAVGVQARTTALVELLDTINRAGARLTVVIDDTDHFATFNDPITETDDVSALYGAVSRLADLPLQIVLGVHPRFREVNKTAHVLESRGFTTVAVAELPHDGSEGLLAILNRRLAAAGSTIDAGEVFSAEARAALEAPYHDRGRHDLRFVLRIARAACIQASTTNLVEASRPLVLKRHVNAALEADQTGPK